MTTRSRVVLAKVGLDGHDVGVNLVANYLLTAGFEVVYLGKRVSTEQIVQTAIAEDAAVVGLSCLSGGLAHFATKVAKALEAEDAEIPVIAGGIEEPAEIERMLAEGVWRYFGPSTSREDLVDGFAEASKLALGAGGSRS
ncbi:cobalamin B12-binding domain-containing protein [Amycolatopsis jejuensis]|uniref:cobalamin B12-binding domain-containing protein n=1 Tax=Amycolatopsis jejuensis TaxID=330084 RepID=UPI000526B645|nr:cobalamin-dependent protein [Amycolatopsis jejuensis]